MKETKRPTRSLKIIEKMLTTSGVYQELAKAIEQKPQEEYPKKPHRFNEKEFADVFVGRDV
jgi:hypothetical protein